MSITKKYISVLLMILWLNIGGAQAGWWETTSIPPPARFLPIPIDEYCNSNTLKDGIGLTNISLPSGKEIVYINDIPFQFPENNNDNIDVGESIFQNRNGEMCYMAKKNWTGTKDKEPGRIQLRFRNHCYQTLWVVAASDGEENSIPMFSAVFYRPEAGFPKIFSGEVPLFSDGYSKKGEPLSVTLTNDKEANLWLVKIPLKPGELSSFSDIFEMEMEITKGMEQWRSYPDPIGYGFFQAGLPSGVHIYALTLEEPEIRMKFEPTKFAHVFTSPEKPGYKISMKNQTDKPQKIKLLLQTTSHNGAEIISQEKSLTLEPNQESVQHFAFSPKLFGYHKIKATLFYAGKEWVEMRSFAFLSPDKREPEWKGEGPLFGYWGYGGEHNTPSRGEEVGVMYKAGARAGTRYNDKMKAVSSAWTVHPLPAFAKKDNYTQEECDAYGKSIVEKIRKEQELPEPNRPDHVFFFPEPHIGTVTSETPPIYYGEPEYKFTEEEKKNIRSYIITAQCVAKAIRKEFPHLKIYIPWGEPLFILVMLRQGYPKELFDGIGIDLPNFERLPEQQLRHISNHRLWMYKQELKRLVCDGKELIFCEGIFVPNEPGASTLDEQKDIFIRWYLLSMAYGINKFYSGIFGFSSCDYYGAEHYGGCGSLNRIPYLNPFPVYTAYATMTSILEKAKFDKWLSTGSLSAYCLRFNRPQGPVYSLWTIRGRRIAKLKIEPEGIITTIDSQNNSQELPIKDNTVMVELSPSPIWVTGIEKITDIKLDEPVYSDKPAGYHILLDDFSKKHWRYDNNRDPDYENNHWDTKRYVSPLKITYTYSDEQNAKALQIELKKPEKDPKLMPLYGRIVPDKTLGIPGKASALGLWVKGNSSWGRIIYKLRDAEGESWTSIGVKDQWNCDDIHSWSFFNFDGWRYLSFPLPSHSEYDSFRELGTTWWKSEDGDSIVDLPLTLESIIIEMRTHIVYVNDIEKISEPNIIQITGLRAEYNNTEDMSVEAIVKNRIRMKPGIVKLPKENPIDKLEKVGVSAPINIEKIEPPEWGYDGTRAHVYFDETPISKEYQVWVSSYPDGRDATIKGRCHKSGYLVEGLEPAKRLYLYLTYIDAQGKQSKPSKGFPVELKDEFGMK